MAPRMHTLTSRVLLPTWALTRRTSPHSGTGTPYWLPPNHPRTPHPPGSSTKMGRGLLLDASGNQRVLWVGLEAQLPQLFHSLPGRPRWGPGSHRPVHPASPERGARLVLEYLGPLRTGRSWGCTGSRQALHTQQSWRDSEMSEPPTLLLSLSIKVDVIVWDTSYLRQGICERGQYPDGPD